jgi:hypothetical protein
MRNLRDAVSRVRQDGRHQQIRCPAHDDQHASLSIDAGAHGGVVLKCHAGCATRGVLEAGGLTMADLQPSSLVPEPSRIIATYSYLDEAHHEVYQVLRLAPKSFRQRRPDGAGGWLWHLDGVRRVLYRLPHLSGATTVWIVEGEKDADRLAAAGLPVTTWAGGAHAWRADYIAQLKTLGAQRLIVLPDNDHPGRRCARTIVAGAVAAGLSARVVELAGLPPKGDASDWLDAGHTVDELWALEHGGAASETYGVALDDFRAYMPDHAYLFAPTRELWPAASVDARLPPMPLVDEDGRPILNANGVAKTIKASLWLDQHQPVEQMTWSPGDPILIRDRLVAEGGWLDRPGCTCFNQYRGPTLRLGRARDADPWIDHVQLLYPNDAAHLFDWLAHRVQRPHEKINHALVVGGAPGIGKDTILEPVAAAIGPWNLGDISAPALLAPFNGYLKSVILRVSEARDLGDVNRYAFYERSKIYTASPPDVLRVNEKHLREYPIRNVCGLVITTNHKTNGLYLPADDRRHYVAWSDFTASDLPNTYFVELYRWFAAGGEAHVAAWLHARSLATFNPKAPPLKTAAFWAIVDASRSPEDTEMANAISGLGDPDALTVDMLADPPTPDDFRAWLKDRRIRPRIPHRLEACGYVTVRNPEPKDGLWVVARRRCVIYARTELTSSQQLAAARTLADHL